MWLSVYDVHDHILRVCVGACMHNIFLVLFVNAKKNKQLR